MGDTLEDFKKMQEEMARLRAQETYMRSMGQFKFPANKHKNKYLYFIQCADVVKIGVASYPQDRMKRLQTGAPAPLVLLASIPKAGHREAECHKRLAHLHVHGEWFRYTSEVNDLIGELS